MLNAALFGQTAAEWRKANPEAKGNMRDYATIEQLLVLANPESANAMFIENGIEQSERVIMLNQLAIKQMKTLSEAASIKPA